jgi:tripartite-type tricarboxylate transporter receptor subunit TctC
LLDELTATRLPYAIVALAPALPHIKSGKVRAIAVAGSNRATALPNVPTIGASVAGYGVSTWIGLLVPYGASVKLVRKLNTDLQTVMHRPEVVERLGSLGYEPRGSTVGDFENRLRADIERYSRIVFDAGIARPTGAILPANADPHTSPAKSAGGLQKPSGSGALVTR